MLGCVRSCYVLIAQISDWPLAVSRLKSVRMNAPRRLPVCGRPFSLRSLQTLGPVKAGAAGGEIRMHDHGGRFSGAHFPRLPVEEGGASGGKGCGIYMPDLPTRVPPNLPPGMVKLRVV